MLLLKLLLFNQNYLLNILPNIRESLIFIISVPIPTAMSIMFSIHNPHKGICAPLCRRYYLSYTGFLLIIKTNSTIRAERLGFLRRLINRLVLTRPL